MTGPWRADLDGMWHPADSDEPDGHGDDLPIPDADDDYDRDGDDR